MSLLVTCLLAMVGAILLQLVIWRWHVPRSQIMGTLKVFFAIFFLTCTVAPFTEMMEYVYFTLCFGFGSLAYAISFTMVAADSPSQSMLLALDEAGNAGLSREELERVVSPEKFLQHRLDLLLKSRHLFCENDRYYVSLAGKRYMNFFLWPRKILGIRREGG